jgi:choline-sulfatase
MNRRELITGAVGVAATAAMRPRQAYAKDRKPNLLYILADDHAGYVLGADGNKQAVTPNLDRLAAGGTRFARHYCNSPVCTPSRQSFLTSQLPHASGVTVLTTTLADDKPTLAKQLGASGYQPAVFGKMHFNQPGKPGLHGFQVAETEDVVGREWLAQVGPAPSFGSIQTKPDWHPFKDPARIWLDADKLPFPRKYEDMEGTWIAQRAVKYMEEHKDDPFAMWVSFMEPHSPFKFPVDDRNNFNPANFSVPAIGPQDAGQIPLIFRDLSPQDKQGIIASYYTSVQFLDKNIGVVLDGLRKLDLENDTLVIYMADHGYSLGQHGRFEKHCFYQPAMRVPMIFRWPGRVRQGAVIEEFTESIDFPPTLLELLGAEPFQVNHGSSMVPYLTKGRFKNPRQSIFSEYLENEEACVRTDRWKYIHCSGKRARTDGYLTDNPTPGRTLHLFDLQKDPGEFYNVADKHPEVVQHLSGEMLKVFRSTHPEAALEPRSTSVADNIEWYLRPRDAPPVTPTA